MWEGAATRRSLDALADIYLITPNNRKHSSAFVSGNKVAPLLAADAYFRFIASQIRLHLHTHTFACSDLIQAGKNTHV